MKKKGFTLVEFLIGMTMTVVIFIVATNLVVSFLSINTKSKRNQDLEEVKVDVSRQITDQLTWGTTITHSSNKLIIDKDTFELVGNTLKKNGSSLTPANVKVKDFSIFEYHNDPENKTAVSYKVEINLEHAESASIKDTISIFSSSRINQ